MRKYTLNDIQFNPSPLTLVDLKEDETVNEAELERERRYNKELMEQLENEYSERQRTGQLIT